jgi:hypothetical protein
VISEEGLAGMNRKLVCLVSLFSIGVIAAAIFYVLPAATQRAKSSSCEYTLNRIVYFAREWAFDHAGQFPTNLLFLSNEWHTVQLICPGDLQRAAATEWATFTPVCSSYEIISPELNLRNTNSVFARCRFHGHCGYVNGISVKGVRIVQPWAKDNLGYKNQQ